MPGNPDFKDLFNILNDAGVRYLVVGAHAVIYHAQPRYTKDLDLWVEPSPANARRLWQALGRFGAPLQGVAVEDFTDPDVIYQIGLEPNRIDIQTAVAGLQFEPAYQGAVETTYDGIPIRILGKRDLITAKTASGRPQDLIDLANLTE